MDTNANMASLLYSAKIWWNIWPKKYGLTKCAVYYFEKTYQYWLFTKVCPYYRRKIYLFWKFKWIQMLIWPYTFIQPKYGAFCMSKEVSVHIFIWTNISKLNHCLENLAHTNKIIHLFHMEHFNWKTKSQCDLNSWTGLFANM